MVDIDIDNILRNFTTLVLLFFVNGVLFDLSITYTVFRHNTDWFVQHEVNNEMVNLLTGGSGFPIISVGHIIVLLLFTLISYYYYERKKNNLSVWLLLSCLFITTIFSAYHYFGGISWLL